MNAVSEGVYSGELFTHQLSPGQYMAVAQKAAARLRWSVAALYDNTIVFRASGVDYFDGELVSVTVGKEKATIQCRPVNEYYHDEAQSSRNIELFKKAVAVVAEEQEKANRNLHPMHREKYGALVISKSYLVTPLLVYANALVLAAMVLAGISPLNPTAQSLFQWGGNFRPAVADGEWWRLLSYMFLHGGGLHLLGNTFALLYIGMFLEPLMGKLRFASAYLFTGVFAGLMSLVFHDATVCVGASGAIFGMYGVFLSVLTTSHIQKTMRKTMLRSILFFVVFNLMMGLQGNTDNAAHIGGLVSGIVIGYVYYQGMATKAPLRRQVLTMLVLAGFVTAISAIVISGFA